MRDLGSRNGILVNGVKTRRPCCAQGMSGRSPLQVKFVTTRAVLMAGAQPPATVPVATRTNAATVVLDHPTVLPLDLGVTKKLP